jgi:alginate O-acetyltransferase complex protein AlgI
MNLSDATFLLFLATVVPAYALVSRGRARVPVLFVLGASLLFYATWNPLWLLPLAATATTDYWVARTLGHTESPRRRRLLLAVSLTVDLALLAAFKYFDVLTAPAAPRVRLLFITGISFYTFQSLSYVLDVYRKMVTPVTRFTTYAAFVGFFPTLLAGPITRAETLIPQLEGPPRPMEPDLASRGLFLIACGFVKKCLLADYLAEQLVGRVFEQPLFYSSLEIAAGLYAYAIQIYCDFAGYSDIAIGAALLLGFRLKDNFRSPYRATTLAEFWQRWHISFSTWLRDYVFFSLPGNRRGRLAPYLNTLITFLIGGIWHGASWGFLIWGLIHGAWLALERRLLPRGLGKAPLWRRALGSLLTFHVVLVAWVFFRAGSLETIGDMARRLSQHTTGAGNIPVLVPLIVLAVLATQWLPERWLEQVIARFAAAPALAQAALLVAVAMAVRLAAGSAIAPFIYQGF